MKKVPVVPILRAVPAIVFAAIATQASAQGVRAQVVAQGLEHPWVLAFLPEGCFLVT